MSSPAVDLRLQEARRALRDASAQLGLVAPPQPGRTQRTHVPTGVPGLDAFLGGGLPRGRVSELTGGRSSGRMAALLHLLGSATAAGEPAALVDVPDALDADGLAPEECARLLWVRPGTLRTALRCADVILDGGGFAVVALYLAGVDAERAGGRSIPASAWTRLVQRAEKASTALLAVTDGSDPRMRPGAHAAVGLEVRRRRAHWLGEGGLLDGAELELRVLRARGAQAGHGIFTLGGSP